MCESERESEMTVEKEMDSTRVQKDSCPGHGLDDSVVAVVVADSRVSVDVH